MAEHSTPAPLAHDTLPVSKIRTDGGTQPRAELSAETIGEYQTAMVAGTTFPPVVVFHDQTPVGIELPLTVDLKIVDTAPELKGATASAQRKPAVTETGLIVQVPPFIGPGESIRISTTDGTYLERVK